MDRKFLIMVAAIAGLTLIVALLVLTIATGFHAVEHPTGGFLLVWAWLGGGFAAMLFLKMNDRIGLSEQTCRVLSLVGFKLAGFFFLAMLISGGHWTFGFWLAFIASIVGAFAVYLTFNPALAKRIADAAREKTQAADESAESKPADEEESE